MIRSWRLNKVRAHLIPIILLVCAVTYAGADTIYGRPVAGIGSTTTVGVYNTSSHQTAFYIPLSSSSSGVYGVTAGTSADTGSGYGYNDANKTALTMYLLFDDPASVVLPVGSASLSFTFDDLDLIGVNDPYYFLESVQFFSSGGSAISPVITSAGQSGSSPLAYSVSTVGGDPNKQNIFFSDVTSILTSPFYITLKFDSKSWYCGTNTPEKLQAKLVTTPAPVPEPATLLLVGGGLAALAGKRKRGSRGRQ